MNVGYLIVRYRLCDNQLTNKLKYGPNQTKVADFVTLVPYEDVKLNK